MSRSITAPVRWSKTYLSGETEPETTASPRPQEPSMMVRGSPVTGCEVNITPAFFASTSSCTTTAMFTLRSSKPCFAR